MNAFANLLRHDRILVLAALIAIVGLAWLYLLLGAGIEMDEMDMGGGQIMLMTPPWTPGYALLVFLMWAIMMVAMMLPSAAPTILLVAALARKQGVGAGAPIAGLFSLGYVLVWTGFSLAVTALQWGLDSQELLSGEMAMASAVVAGCVLIAAGIYQWTPLKQACLLHCRSPLAFLLHHWRPGGWGALTSGLQHGIFCLGCCWMLMALLFVGGLMNLLWVAGLSLLVLVEKVLPWGDHTSRAIGLVLLVWGAATVATTLWAGVATPG